MRPTLKSSNEIGRWVALALGLAAYAVAVVIAMAGHP